MYLFNNSNRPTTKQRLLTLITIVSLPQMLNSRPSWALDPTPNLTPTEIQATIKLLQACDRARTAAQAQIQTDTFVQSKQDELIKAQTAEVVQLKDAQNSLFKSPILWFAAGMLVTGLTVHWVR